MNSDDKFSLGWRKCYFYFREFISESGSSLNSQEIVGVRLLSVVIVFELS